MGFLKNKYGSLIRAWRKVLSSDGSMTLQKVSFFKAVNNMGWPGDVRQLWQMLDRDDSGYASIEEIDAKGAQLLAHFHNFGMQRFGGASAALRALDKADRKKLRQDDFTAALKAFGFQFSTRALFQAFDTNATKTIVESDMKFLD